MLQSILVLIIVLISVGYVSQRLYNSIKKKKECDKCALMDAAKKAQLK
jgi:hypothetical protein